MFYVFQVDKQTLEKQLQTERQKAAEGEKKAKEVQKKEDEIRKLTQQLDTLKVKTLSTLKRGWAMLDLPCPSITSIFLSLVILSSNAFDFVKQHLTG